jgi:flagellar motor component MotA
MRKLISLVLVFGLVLAAICSGSPPGIFIDLNSILIVFGVVVGGALFSFRPRDLVAAVCLVCSNGPLDPQNARSAKRIFERLSNLAIGAGFAGALIGLVQMLQQMDDPRSIGPAMAVALLTQFYGLVLAEFIFSPAASECTHRAFPESDLTRPQGLSFGKLLGFVLLVSSVLLGIVLGSPLSSFFNAPSVVLVLGLLLGGVFSSHSWADVRQGFCAYFGPEQLSESEARKGYSLFSRLSELALGAGLIGTLIGLVQMLQALDDPTKIGPALALALLTLFYGVIFSVFVFRGAAADCLMRANIDTAEDSGMVRSRGFAMLTNLFLVLLIFFVMLVAIASFGEECATEQEAAVHLEEEAPAIPEPIEEINEEMAIIEAEKGLEEMQ